MKKDMLSETQVRRNLEKNKNRIIAVYEETASTNLLAKELFKDDGAVVIAEKQSAGRGRMGRNFFSPEGSGLYMSVSVKRDILPDDAVFVTVAAALAVSRAIDRLFDISTQIKWVNDIYYKGKKVCGILAETVWNSEKDKPLHIVVGIGVNTSEPCGGFPEEIKDKAAALPDKNVSRNALAAEVINELDKILDEFEKKDFLEEYRQKSCLTGKKVTVIPINGREFEAEVLGIDDNAHLVIIKDNGEKINLFTGEVSIKI